MPSAELRDQDAEPVNFHRNIRGAGNLCGWVCRAVMLTKDEDFYRLVSSLL